MVPHASDADDGQEGCSIHRVEDQQADQPGGFEASLPEILFVLFPGHPEQVAIWAQSLPVAAGGFLTSFQQCFGAVRFCRSIFV